MPNWKISAPQTKTYDFLLFDGFSNHCLANAVEPLRAANTLAGRPLYEWRYTSLHGGTVTSSSDLQVAAPNTLEQASGDTLLVMPSYGFRAYCDWKTRHALRAAAERYRAIAGLDTGSWLLASAGLLNSREATIHAEELDSFAEAFPDITATPARFIIDGNRITCSGASAAFDLSLQLITRDCGQSLALEISRIFLLQSGSARTAPAGFKGSKLINKTIEIMQSHFEPPLPIAAIADKVGCSQKTLETRVKSELGVAPSGLYKRLRLAKARKLLQETDFAVSDIALRCGYDNPSAMTRAFRSEYGQSPRELRSSAQKLRL